MNHSSRQALIFIAVTVASAAMARSPSPSQDDASRAFMTKNENGAIVIIHDSELDKPAQTNISGGATAIVFHGKPWKVDATLVTRFGKTSVVDRSAVLSANDEH